MTLIATGSSTPPADAAVLAGNGFWPDLEPAAYRAAHRLDGTVTPARLLDALGAAVRDVDRQLAAFQAAQVAAGVSAAADIPRQSWQATGHHASLYRQAVYCTATAWLIERYADLAATGERDAAAVEQKLAQVNALRRDVRWALSELTDIEHVTVELI